MKLDDYWVALREQNVGDLRALLDEAPERVHAGLPTGPWKVEYDGAFRHLTRGIHVCSFAGREETLAVILRHQPDLEALTFEENKGITTALVLAAWEGSLESCRLLLKAGANPNACASAESPLYAAAEHHAWDKVDLLVAHGAKHDIFTASISGAVDVVAREIEAYPPLVSRTSLKRGRTPLEEAVEHDQAAVVELLRAAP